MAQLHVSLPADLQRYVEGRASAADVRRVRLLVEEGIASGIVDREPEDILDEVIAEIRTADD